MYFLHRIKFGFRASILNLRTVIVLEQTYPIVWILMTHRTTDAYAAALQYVNDNIFEINGSGIIIDFEKAMRAGIKRVSPNIRILGCWFHFAQALKRKMASLTNLFTLIRSNPDAKIIFRKFQTLALLPHNTTLSCIYYERHYK